MSHNMSFGDNNKNARQQSSTGRWTRTPAASLATRLSMASTSYAYGCTICGKTFKFSSLLAAHKREHEAGSQTRSMQRRDTATVEALHNRCRYCDRKFDLERTLHIHQLQHCAKITPQERRKLSYNELCHEGRATPLPKFHRDVPPTPSRATAGALGSSSASSESSTVMLASSTIPEKSRNWHMEGMASSSNVNVSAGRSAKPKAPIVRQRNNKNNNKLIPCFMCKQSFETLADLSVHTRSLHNSVHQGHAE